MSAYNDLRQWAHRIYAATPDGVPNRAYIGTGEPHYRQAAIALLRQWLLEPEQSGVYEVLRTGLAQLCWDTPSSAGRRLIADLIWRSVLNRFGVVPALSTRHSEEGHLIVEVVDSPYAHESWDFSGWRIHVMIHEPGLRIHDSSTEVPEIEFVLNALLFYDVELGLADRPLYERLRQASGRKNPDKTAGFDESTQTPKCPVCSSPMRLKNRSRSHEPFWGCTNYPRCKGKLPHMPFVPRGE